MQQWAKRCTGLAPATLTRRKSDPPFTFVPAGEGKMRGGDFFTMLDKHFPHHGASVETERVNRV